MCKIKLKITMIGQNYLRLRRAEDYKTVVCMTASSQSIQKQVKGHEKQKKA